MRDTAKRIHQRALSGCLPVAEDGLRGIGRIAINEFATLRGHRYDKLVSDLDRERAMRPNSGCDETQLRGFLTRLGATRSMETEAIAMDMWMPCYMRFRMRIDPTRLPRGCLFYRR